MIQLEIWPARFFPYVCSGNPYISNVMHCVSGCGHVHIILYIYYHLYLICSKKQYWESAFIVWLYYAYTYTVDLSLGIILSVVHYVEHCKARNRAWYLSEPSNLALLCNDIWIFFCLVCFLLKQSSVAHPYILVCSSIKMGTGPGIGKGQEYSPTM